MKTRASNWQEISQKSPIFARSAFDFWHHFCPQKMTLSIDAGLRAVFLDPLSPTIFPFYWLSASYRPVVGQVTSMSCNKDVSPNDCDSPLKA
jgi:hypothetical protein